MAEIRFFFEYGKQVVQLPVNPEKLEIKSNGSNETTEIISLGEINILKQKKLSEIAIECFFPKNSSPPYVLTKGDFKNAEFYINFFEEIRKNKNPMRFIVSGTSINMPASIESFDWCLNAGDDDTSYSMSIKEYKEHSIKILKVNENQNQSISTNPPTESRTNTSNVITNGATVVVNGRLHRDSFGGGPGQTRTNYIGKINYIKNGRACPYHVTTPTGAWQGWVKASAVKRV